MSGDRDGIASSELRLAVGSATHTGLRRRANEDSLLANRRARLVEYAVLSRLVTKADLPLLDAPHDDADDR